MALKLCHHILESGKLCRCPALRGCLYCYSHNRQLKRQRRMARMRAELDGLHAKEREEVVKILYFTNKSIDLNILRAPDSANDMFSIFCDFVEGRGSS